MNVVSDTPAQREVRERFTEACHELSMAAVALKDARHRYDRAHEQYLREHGAAKQAGVIVV